MIVALFIASVIIFAITSVLPGDVAQMILGQNVTPQALHALRQKLGLDKPVYVRYLEWIGSALHGNLGTSLSIPGVRISWLLVTRGENTLFLAFFAGLFLIPTSLGFGIVAGLKEGSWVDNLISSVGLIAISLPEFVSGLLLITLFSVWLRVLPATSSIDLHHNLFSQFPKLVLPILTVSFVIFGYILRMARVSVIEVSRADYIRTAILKGLPRRRVIISHIVHNALLPSITVIAMNMGWMMGGLVVTETVFAFPGLGRLLLFALKQRDIPLLQATILTVGAIYLFLNLLADITYGFLNPQVRYNE